MVFPALKLVGKGGLEVIIKQEPEVNFAWFAM
jgi:hypothetical protein